MRAKRRSNARQADFMLIMYIIIRIAAQKENIIDQGAFGGSSFSLADCSTRILFLYFDLLLSKGRFYFPERVLIYFDFARRRFSLCA